MKLLNHLFNTSYLTCLVFMLALSSTNAQWNDSTGFEQGWGIWNDGGSDAYRLSTNVGLSGTYSARIRDNSGVASSIYTDQINLSGQTRVNIQFQYIAESMETGEDFFLEYSSNGGATYEKIRTYVSGTDFSNGQVKSENVDATSNFTNNSVFRFRCDASSNYDMVYIDNVVITAGTTGGTTASTCDQKNLWIRNQGSCPVNVYWWQTSGDIYYATINAGQQWDVSTSPGHVWRVVDTHNDWNNLKHDETYTVNDDCEQVWNINPTYCSQPVYDCANLSANIGDACNDGNAQTTNDVVNSNCQCAGTAVTPTCDQKNLWIRNQGSCPVNVYWWQTSGDIYYATINAGQQWDVSTSPGHVWRVVDTHNDWNNLKHDETYTVNDDCEQVWNINPTYCNQPVYDCANLSANIGDACNDGNAQTTNDVINSNCQCVGTPVTPTCDQKNLWIRNQGSCPVNVYWWQASGDIYYATINAGQQWDVSTSPGHVWRVVDTHNDWNNLKHDETYTVNDDCEQVWNINPTYCNQPVYDCANLSANIGDACNDGNAQTTNDVVNSNCQCAGTPVTPTCDQKNLWIRNQGSCPVNVYWWQTSGDIYYATINAGQQWDVSTSPGHVWRVVDTHNDWNNLKHDETYTVNDDCEQVWNINPTYCNQPVYDCANLSANIGDACNDGNAQTTNDVVNSNCQCAGTPVTPTCDQKNLWIRNQGSCPVNVYWWQTSGDIYYATINAGQQWDVSTSPGHVWRVVDTHNDWNNLKHDETYTVNDDCEQVWNINPTYCNQPVYDCPNLSANIGDACNDGNAQTTNDVINSNCQCAGTAVATTCDQKNLTITNAGLCSANIFWVNGSNDVFYTTLSPGQSWDITTSTGHIWRAIETGEGFNNQLFDQSYTVTKECNQTWSISPRFCTFANNGGGTTGTTSTCTPKLVHYQGFESGWGQWTDGGSDCARNYEPSLNTVGNYCVQLRDNSNVASSTVTTRLNFTSVQEVKVDFMYIAESMEHGEDFMLEYSTNDGATYTTVQSWKSGTDFFNGETKTESVSFTGNFNSTTKLRFRCDASTNYDFVYLDEISIYACGGAWLDDDSGTQYSTRQSGAVDMDFNNESATAATTIEVAVTEDTTPAAKALKIYPIPSTHTITIDGLNGQTYDVYNISGQRIIKASNDQVLDISDLQNGTYVLRTIGGQMMRFNKI